MHVLVRELVMRLDYTKRDLVLAAAGRLGVVPGALELVRIERRSLDARPVRKQPSYILNAVFDVMTEFSFAGVKNAVPVGSEEPARLALPGWTPGRERPVVVGAGPAGLFAAFTLALCGARPLLIERGKPIEKRQADVGRFWGRGELERMSNVLSGEGGAGAFSDGKLTSRSKDHEGQHFVLKTLVECGAPGEILYEAQAHLGSDRLAHIIPKLRSRICGLGGEVRFSCNLEEVLAQDGNLRALRLAEHSPHGVRQEELACGACVLATGHSAREVYYMLDAAGVPLEPKGFAVGVRAELPQDAVNRRQLGNFADYPGIGAAEFRLTYEGRCHSFCMCPGGSVIACADEPGLLCTNGMSLSSRTGKLANAAFLIPLPALPTALEGLEFLAGIERKTFAAGGGDYALPFTTLKAFPEAVRDFSCGMSARRARPADFREILPEQVLRELEACLRPLLARVGGGDGSGVIIYGTETRSTSPLRISRGADYQSTGLRGVYPVGEGGGYAGGIISSAIDGVRAALALAGGS